jgi:hypothetical protein
MVGRVLYVNIGSLLIGVIFSIFWFVLGTNKTIIPEVIANFILSIPTNLSKEKG